MVLQFVQLSLVTDLNGLVAIGCEARKRSSAQLGGMAVEIA